jgi:xanthine dehydrogenase YagR molybdenum-binding subunit
MPGVLAIITPTMPASFRTRKRFSKRSPDRCCKNKDIPFNGQHVAGVVGDAGAGAGGLPAVRVTYSRGEATTSMDAMLGQAYVPTHFRSGQGQPDSKSVDPDGSFNGGAVKLDTTYITPIEHHNPMEPHATIAMWNGDALTVWTTTQGIGGAQASLAGQFGIDKADVRVICPYLGAGFGSKGNTWTHATWPALAARQVNVRSSWWCPERRCIRRTVIVRGRCRNEGGVEANGSLVAPARWFY